MQSEKKVRKTKAPSKYRDDSVVALSNRSLEWFGFGIIIFFFISTGIHAPTLRIQCWHDFCTFSIHSKSELIDWTFKNNPEAKKKSELFSYERERRNSLGFSIANGYLCICELFEACDKIFPIDSFEKMCCVCVNKWSRRIDINSGCDYIKGHWIGLNWKWMEEAKNTRLNRKIFKFKCICVRCCCVSFRLIRSRNRVKLTIWTEQQRRRF